jgi:nitrite reductase/ring-hydroxylating ferredoxin subunit
MDIVHRLCSLSELRREGRVTLWVDELRDEITAIASGPELKVFSSVCPHFGGEFDFSGLASGRLKCRWHAWSFDWRDGTCLSYPLKTKLRHYDFRADEAADALFVLAR